MNDHCRNAAIDLRVNEYVMRQRISFCPNEQVLDDGNVNKYGRLLGVSWRSLRPEVTTAGEFDRVIALISVNIVTSWDIEGRQLASVRRYSNEGQYSSTSV